MEILVIIIIVVTMIAACIFVWDTKKKHGVSYGKMCAGYPIDDNNKKENKENSDT